MNRFRFASRSANAAGHRPFRLAGALVAVLAAMLPPAAARSVAAEPVATGIAAADSSPLRFRRVYIPEDQIDRWPREGVRYLPMKAGEFERLVGGASGGHRPAPGVSAEPVFPGALQSGAEVAQPPNTDVVRAVYEARLQGDVLSGGRATLQIRHAGSAPSLLSLEPCRLAIQAPVWAEPPPAAASPASSPLANQPPQDLSTQRPAILGVGADKQLTLRVEKSGSLEFAWTLVGQRETGAALAFDLQLPPAASNELRLTLPPGLVPTVEQGFVSLVADEGTASVASVKKDRPSARRWTIDVGGQTQFVVRLAPRDFLRDSRPLTLVRQSLAYSFSPHGMQLSADLKLDVLGEPIERIAMVVDRPLTLVTARSGGTQLSWYETDAAGKKPGAADSNAAAGPARDRNKPPTNDPLGPRRIVVEFPEPIHGTGRLVRLGFVAPSISRSRLPVIRPADEGLFWQEGSASLLVPLPLELDELTLKGCRQTKAEPLPAPSLGDAISLQYFRPDADVNVAIKRRGDRLQVRSGTTIDAGGNRLTGHYVADVSAQEGECFSLSAGVSPDWIIDSVETVPTDALADWSYKPSAGSAFPLEIALAKSVRPDQPVRLIINGRWRRAPPGERLRPNDLALATLREAPATRRVVAVHPGPPYRLQTTGAETLHRLDPKQLSAIDTALLGGGSIGEGTLLFVDDEAADDLAVRLANDTPRFSGTVRLDAQITDASLVEAYRIRCKPESAELDRLLVHFSRRREEPMRWTLVDSDSGATQAGNRVAIGRPSASDASGIAGIGDSQDQIVARRFSADEQAAAGLTAGGEVWELTFRQPGSKPIEIQAVRTSALAADTPLSLAELVKADEQQGSVAIWSAGRRIPQINNRRLKPLAIAQAATGASPAAADSAPRKAAELAFRGDTELAAYDYSPVEEIVSAAVDPAPSLTVSPAAERPDAWAWSGQLDSYYSPDGSSQHVACWRIENTGRKRVRIQLPSGGTFQSAWIDDILATAGTLSTDTAPASSTPTNAASPNAAPPNAATSANAASRQAGASLPPAQGAAVRLELPTGRRFVQVVLQWGTTDEPLGLLSSRTSQLAEIDMPVLAREWHVWLPPRFQVNGSVALRRSAFDAAATWSQRLFGPFGRAAGQSVFNPLDSEAWAGLVRPLVGRDEAWAEARQFVARLQERAQTARSPVSSPMSWGELLAGALPSMAGRSELHPLPLLIAARALADIGLTPQTAVRLPSPDAAGGSPLTVADLVVLVDPKALVLTSRSAAAVWMGPGSADQTQLQCYPSGPFQTELKQSLDATSARFIPVEQWSFPEGQSPWGHAAIAGNGPSLDHAGWAVYDFSLFDTPRRIGIADRDTMLAIGFGVFLLTLLLVLAKHETSGKRQAIGLTAATALALLVPAACVPLGAGLWLGLAAGFALQRLLRGNRPIGGRLARLRRAMKWSESNPPLAEAVVVSERGGDSGDTTLPAVVVQAPPSAAPSDSKSPRSLQRPSGSAGSSIRKRGGPPGPTLGLLLAIACLAWHDAGAAEPNSGAARAAGAQIGAAQAGAAPAPSTQLGAGKTGANSVTIENGGDVDLGGTSVNSGPGSEVDQIPAVLIPCDAQQQPKGDFYLVPEGLYLRLIRRGELSSDTNDDSQHWLITSANYRGGLVRLDNAGSAGSGALGSALLGTTDWSAEYDLEVFSLPAHIAIPFGDNDTNLLPDGLRVDGKTIPFQWEKVQPAARSESQTLRHTATANGRPAAGYGDKTEEDGRVCTFNLVQAGHHQVSLAFRPTAHDLAGATTVSYPIPRLANSRLELSAPADARVEVPGARGEPSLDRSIRRDSSNIADPPASRLTERLGPIGRLTVHGWPTSNGGSAKAPVVDVDELYWLKVRPGSVTLDAEFNVRVAEGKLMQLRLLEDPRLRRLPLEAGSPIREMRTEEGELHTIYVGLGQPVVDRVSFKLSFLLTDTSGIGNLRLPRLEALGVRSAQKELAVSVDPPLEFDPSAASPPTAATPLAPVQFLSAWGAAEAKPQLAYKLAAGDTAWSLPIHSRQPQIESREQTVIAIERGRLHETWLADLSVVGGSVFQIQIPAPPQWTVETALLRQEGSPDQPVRWARTPNGGLTLFLSGPAAEHSKLLLRGEMPYADGAHQTAAMNVQLPDLRVAGPSEARVASQSILLLRGADVRLAVSNPAGLQPSPMPALNAAVARALADGLLERFALGRLRPVACLAGREAAGNGPAIRVEANAPRLEGKETTTVRRVNDTWKAAVDLDFKVSGGVLDTVRFDLPPQWADISEISPSTPSQLLEVPGEHRRQLVLRPSEPWTGEVRLHLSGPISTAAGQRVRVPDVLPSGNFQLRRYVLLPTRAGDQNLSWEASGLNFEPLPKRFAPDSSQVDVYRICEVVAEHFEATLKSVDKTIRQPRVHLADIAVTYSDAGQCYGTATFDLDPAGTSSCLLELAPNERLIHARADGVAAIARPVAENHWSIALGDAALPQQLEVVFTAELKEASRNGRLLLPAPVLIDLPVEQTLWTVSAASDGAVGGSLNVAGAAPATAVDQDLIRLRTISQLLESAGSPPATDSGDQLAKWFGPWSDRLRMARAAIDRWRAGAAETTAIRNAVKEMHAIDERQAKLVRRLGIKPAKPAAEQQSADEAFALWKQTDEPGGPTADYYVHGIGPTLALGLPRRGPDEVGWRLLTAILGAGGMGMMFWLAGRPGRWSAFFASPPLIAVAIGLFWWLGMEPSWLGLLIVAGGLVAAIPLRPSRPKKAEPAAPPSTQNLPSPIR